MRVGASEQVSVSLPGRSGSSWFRLVRSSVPRSVYSCGLWSALDGLRAWLSACAQVGAGEFELSDVRSKEFRGIEDSSRLCPSGAEGVVHALEVVEVQQVVLGRLL